MSARPPPGTLNARILRELARSKGFWPWATAGLHGAEFPKNRRNVFAMAMFQVAYDHQATIVEAVKAVRFASALALVRPLCEATLMGMWILHAATEDVLEALGQSRYAPPQIDDLVKALDRKGFFDAPMYRDIKHALKRMHSFTHGGLLHIAARYQGVRVGANYEVDPAKPLRAALQLSLDQASPPAFPRRIKSGPPISEGFRRCRPPICGSSRISVGEVGRFPVTPAGSWR